MQVRPQTFLWGPSLELNHKSRKNWLKRKKAVQQYGQIVPVNRNYFYPISRVLSGAGYPRVARRELWAGGFIVTARQNQKRFWRSAVTLKLKFSLGRLAALYLCHTRCIFGSTGPRGSLFRILYCEVAEAKPDRPQSCGMQLTTGFAMPISRTLSSAAL